VLPRPVALAVFARLGDLVRTLDRKSVRRARVNLELALGAELSAAERERILRRLFRTTGRNLVDLLRLGPFDRDRAERLVTVEGAEHADAALARGKGVVALSAHLGNWEVLAATMRHHGYPVHVIARELFDPRLDRLVNSWRERAGVVVHPRGSGLVSAARVLRKGEVLAALPDQDTRGPGVFVDFFGRPARTPSGPFALSRRTGAPLLPVLTHLDGSGRHRIRVWPAIEASDHPDPDEALREDVAAWHRVLEQAIREHPEQWVWYHGRWKTRPESEGAPSFAESSKEAAYLPSFQPSKGLAKTR
jgi:KDO2-lipid IV(A) lauroyltransferase